MIQIISIIGLAFPVYAIYHCIHKALVEKRDYNNGICKQCGEPLKFVDGWLHGSTYKCKNGHVYEFETI